MSITHGGWLVAKILKREGVEVVFTLSGGHIAAIYDGCVREGIRVVDTRHEQAAVHAAEGWAKCTRRPGVALLTAGPGVTDGVTGVANAYLAGSPVLVIGGAAPLSLWDRGALQEMNQIDLLRPITKWARTVHETGRIAEYVAAAFRQMLNGKPGPVFLEIPMDVLNNLADTDNVTDPGEPSNYRPAGPVQPTPEQVERAAALLEQAERPVIMAGSAVWWCDGAEALRELAERIQAPVYLNGAGRGCLPPTHPLFFSASRRKALEGADTILAVGTRMDFRLNHGRPPLIPAEARLIWFDLAGEDIGVNRGAEVGLVGDVGIAMRQVAAASKPYNGERAWLRFIREEEARAWERDAAALNSDAVPIHPMRLCKEIRDFIDEETTVIGDGGDIVSYGGRVINVYRPGYWLDAGPMGTLGTGTGFAMAAQLARPGKRVLILHGDGAFGLNGMEFESMVRHKLPVVSVIGNDGAWGQIKHPQKALIGHATAAELAPGIRYDKMVEALGGYGELVERPEEIRPALERAFASGLPACINVLIDPDKPYSRSTNVAV
ncbi:MAG: acetolactate synthase [Thermogemmatispora sp.]|uniref:acetolactate synthase n=1 Tax=Thermogemmatispora sp. TaxID=1968838 RepID=UPI00261F3CEB|nr:acetolactate synthase [Thermogemmatispora sp.]MBX5457326.1 acetolactate synthase [Thermogemmatispora sp.]